MSNKELIQMLGIKINQMGWANIRELKEIIDDEYNKRERMFYKNS